MADFEAARESYGLIRSNADGNSRQFNALCWSLATVNFDLETALHDCDAALKLEPGEPAYLDSRAMVLLRMGRYQEAIEMYDQALEKSADFAVSQYGRGLAKIKSGDLAGGQADLKAAERLHPGISAEYKHMGLDWP
jgi:tetratricopeptide (TPR) repeat protein